MERGRALRLGDRYELEALIGKGGIGEVWRARHTALDTEVAIKFLQGGANLTPATRHRFLTEARVTAQLKTRHAVQVFDFGVTDDGHPYLVMELLEGHTLGHRLEEKKHLGVAETVRILGQCARALHRAHQLGIVHRDFKPDNVIIGVDEEGHESVKIVDFGIAKLVGELDAIDEAPTLRASEIQAGRFTRTGTLLGTPFYMAPEQVRGDQNVDLRADIWAFGVVAFECLTGKHAFVGATIHELFESIKEGRHVEAGALEPALPAAFDAWFSTACAVDPLRRFRDASEASQRLAEALDCRDALGAATQAPAVGPHHVIVPARAPSDHDAGVTLGATRHDGLGAHELAESPLAQGAGPSRHPASVPPVSLGDQVARTLSLFVGASSAKVVLARAAQNALGRTPETLDERDWPRVEAELRPLLLTLLGRSHASLVLGEIQLATWRNRFRLIAALPFVLTAVFAGTIVLSPADARPAVLHVGIATAKVLGLLGSVTAALGFRRGAYLRRAWWLNGAAYALLLVRDAVAARFPDEHSFHGLVEAVVFLANAFSLVGIVLMARAWQIAGLRLPGSRTARRATVVVAAIVSIVIVGPSFAVDLRDAIDFSIFSDLGDVVSFCLIAPVLLTAIALRGGLLNWPWALMCAGMMAWLAYDAATTIVPLLFGAGLAAQLTVQCARALACMLEFSAGMAQRLVVSVSDGPKEGVLIREAEQTGASP